MITKVQLRILEILTKIPLQETTVSVIKKELNIKSQSLIPNYLKELETQNLITKRKIGNLNLYLANFKNPIIFNYISIIGWSKFQNKTKDILIELANNLPNNSSMIIFGSYANKTNTKSSDLDIAIITKNKNIDKYIEDIKLRSLIPLDIHIIIQKDFENMLNAKYENLGKQIIEKNIPLTNPKTFYEIALDKHQNRI